MRLRLKMTGVLVMVLMLFAGFSCGRGNPAVNANNPNVDETNNNNTEDVKTNTNEARTGPLKQEEKTAVLAGGCFWCTEGVFQNLDGVTDVVSGYAGGSASTANYSDVTSGRTNHAEAIKITYNPQKITYGQLLKVFFTVAHDPTTLNRQGNDVGRQYRSAIFYENEQQKDIAEKYIEQLDSEKVFGKKKITTTVEPLEAFYPAEDYHQDYIWNNPNLPYVRYQALPKVEKLMKTYPEKIKK